MKSGSRYWLQQKASLTTPLWRRRIGQLLVDRVAVALDDAEYISGPPNESPSASDCQTPIDRSVSMGRLATASAGLVILSSIIKSNCETPQYYSLALSPWTQQYLTSAALVDYHADPIATIFKFGWFFDTSGASIG
jgi:hypothetical protein